MFRNKWLFQILSQNFILIQVDKHQIIPLEKGISRLTVSPRRPPKRIACRKVLKTWFYAQKFHCASSAWDTFSICTNSFHVKTTLFYDCASVLNVELILLHFVHFFVFYFSPFTIPPLKSIYVPHALAFKRSYSSKVVSPSPPSWPFVALHVPLWINPLNPQLSTTCALTSTLTVHAWDVSRHGQQILCRGCVPKVHRAVWCLVGMHAFISAPLGQWCGWSVSFSANWFSRHF